MSEPKTPGRGPEDEPATAEEEAAAAALRRALGDGEPAGSARAEVESAALLGFSRDAGALAPERAEAVLRRVLEPPAAPRAAAAPAPARRRRAVWRWAVPAAACAAAAAALLVVGLRGGGAGLPAGPPALLRAQLEAGRGGPAAGAALEREMGAYRERLYATLTDRYQRRR
jgi:anti-sigma-K factor RskA